MGSLDAKHALSALKASNRPPGQVPFNFPLQSYLDASFEVATAPSPTAQAVVQQATGTEGFAGEVKRSQTAGYALAAAPWNETPIAVQFVGAGKGGNSDVLVLRPGEILTPHGAQEGLVGDQQVNFSGFFYGLPFGWLGGGQGTLYVLKTPGAYIDWQTDRRDILFHRFQTTIIESSDNPPAVPYKNWPTRFPWDQVYRGVTGGVPVDQRNTPVLCVEPTRTALRLNIDPDNVIDPSGLSFRVVWWSADDFATRADGTIAVPATATSAYWESTWPGNPAFGATKQKPVVFIPPDFGKIAANTWGITIEAPAGSDLLGLTVDVLRYGKV